MKVLTNRRTKLNVATASALEKDRLAFVRKFYDAIYNNVLKQYVETLGDENASERFKLPETSYQPTAKSGGGTVYFVHCALRNYNLSVQFMDTQQECILQASLMVSNPYTEKQTVLIDAEAKEAIDATLFAQGGDARAKFARKVGGSIVRNIRQQITEDMRSLQAHLTNLKLQVKTYTALLNTFKADEKQEKAQ